MESDGPHSLSRAVPDAMAVIGWDIRVDTSTAIAMGFGGRILRRWTKAHRRGATDPYEVAARILTGTTEIVEELPDHCCGWEWA